MAKLFRLLRHVTNEHGLDNRGIAEIIGCSAQHVSDMLCGKAVFTQAQQYALMDYLGWRYSDMYLLFPKNGIEVKENKRIDIVREYCDETGKILVDKSTAEILKTAVQALQ